MSVQVTPDNITTSLSELDIESSRTLIFNPPVYIQRYIAVRDILEAEPWCNLITKVVDFGCAELKFFKYIKPLKHIQHFYAVDIDETLIRKASYEAKPLILEYVSGYSRKLIVDLFVGNIAKSDTRLFDADAVVCIELIEHLYPEILEKVPSTVFEYIQPQIAIFTTPNADFNVLFNLKTFRHDDHKFEWTRKEFADWCLSVVGTYRNYNVYFEGIGQGPKGTEHLGCCSQMAVFTRKKDCATSYRGFEQLESYKLYNRYVYPYQEDERSEMQKFMDELKYRINYIKTNKIYNEFQRYDGKFEIPIHFLFNYFGNWCPTEEIFIERLLEYGYSIENNGENFPIVIVNEDSCTESEESSENEDYIPVCDTNYMENEN